jgi:hypothetical protein
VLQHQANQATHALGDHRNHHLTHTPEQPKVNRLRKACDSCSARKVKVSPVERWEKPAVAWEASKLADRGSSVMKGRHAKRVPPSRYPAPSNGRARGEDRLTGMPRPSRSGSSMGRTGAQGLRHQHRRRAPLKRLHSSHHILRISPPNPYAPCRR